MKPGSAADTATQKPERRRDRNAQSNHVPPLPNVLVVLPPPNRPPPVLLFVEPNPPVFVEPKPEAKDELERSPEKPGAVALAHRRRVRERQSH